MNKAAIFLLVLGLLQMTGDLLDRAGLSVIGQPLKGIGAATTASPAPKVFSSVKGLETYSTRFYLEWTDRRDQKQQLLLSPEVYGQVRGPYNRRNVYGAALAYGPVLVGDERTRPMVESVVRYALCGEAPLLRELGVDPADVSPRERFRIRYEPIAGTNMGTLPQVLEVACP